MIKDYYTLTKPGIIYGNGLTLLAGFILASHAGVAYGLLCLVLIGLSLVIASGCVFNNYIDRDIDALMERTKKRALVKGVIPVRSALLFGALLGILGFGVLLLFTNTVTVIASIVGFFVYVVVYSLWLKRASPHSALIGSISGAIPIMVGYLAVTGKVDSGAIILFLVLVFWQMPHSFAIALYRLQDYEAASIPVFPIKNGVKKTKIHIVGYSVLFVASMLALFVYGYVTQLYLFVMAVLGLVFIGYSFFGFYCKNGAETTLWARRMFIFSIVILLVFSCMIVTAKN